VINGPLGQSVGRSISRLGGRVVASAWISLLRAHPQHIRRELQLLTQSDPKDFPSKYADSSTTGFGSLTIFIRRCGTSGVQDMSRRTKHSAFLIVYAAIAKNPCGLAGSLWCSWSNPAEDVRSFSNTVGVSTFVRLRLGHHPPVFAAGRPGVGL